MQGKLGQEQVASWIKTIDFPIEDREDFYKFSNFRSCLLEVYIQLDQKNSLQDALKEAIQSFFSTKDKRVVHVFQITFQSIFLKPFPSFDRLIHSLKKGDLS